MAKQKKNKAFLAWSDKSDGIIQVWGDAPLKEADFLVIPRNCTSNPKTLAKLIDKFCKRTNNE